MGAELVYVPPVEGESRGMCGEKEGLWRHAHAHAHTRCMQALRLIISLGLVVLARVPPPPPPPPPPHYPGLCALPHMRAVIPMWMRHCRCKEGAFSCEMTIISIATVRNALSRSKVVLMGTQVVPTTVVTAVLAPTVAGPAVYPASKRVLQNHWQVYTGLRQCGTSLHQAPRRHGQNMPCSS